MNKPVSIKPMSPLRGVIASRMQESKQSIPHYRIAMEVAVDGLLALRKQLNEAGPGQKISINDFIVKACAEALMEKPELNIQLLEGEVHQYQQADISVVVAVEDGLLTPIIREANKKTLQEISSQIRDLSKRARHKQLMMDEIAGGTFSISNLGMYGVDWFDAIINPPQCAMLAVAAVKEQVLAKNGDIRVAKVIKANLSVDHRVIDGAVAADFLTVLRNKLQSPECLCR